MSILLDLVGAVVLLCLFGYALAVAVVLCGYVAMLFGFTPGEHK